MNGLLLILIILIQFSCSNPEQSKPVQSKEPSEIIKANTSSKLKFTSSIRSIFEDSKGNYWFGSLQEGLAIYKDSSFFYFTDRDGLTDNQIHSIQEDKEGIIWFNTQSFDGIRIKNHSKVGIETLQNNYPIQSNDPVQGKWIKSDYDI